jgi:outer membrane protein assembly factor BamA
MTRRVACAAWCVLVCAPVALAQPTGPVAEVRIHGNYYTTDAEVVRLSGLTVGQPLPSGGVDLVRERLERSHQFVSVEVRVRFRSLDEHGDVAVVIIVQEYPRSVITVPTEGLGPPNLLQRLGDRAMFSPVLDYADGYGLTYGLRTSVVHVFGKEGRLSIPATWGGRKQIALEADKTFAAGPVSRVSASASLSSRENPAFDIDDERHEINGEVLLPLRRRFATAAITGGWTDVDFGSVHDQFATYGARLTLDTRTNPAFPRNAVNLSAGWRSFGPDSAPRANRFRVEAQGYLGLWGTSVLAVRALSDTSDKALPLYEKALVGGAGSLRGFRAGSFSGDSMAAGTVELRLPTHSAMHMAQNGFTVFGDVAAAYDHGTTLSEATWHYGAGVGWYLRAPLIAINVDVAYGFDRGARAHVTAAVKF